MMDDMIRRAAAIKEIEPIRYCGDFISALIHLPAVDAVPVVRCADCVHCCDLKDDGPMAPYSGDGDGSFFCDCFEMDFYAPRYRAETYFCADGERRKEE